MCPTCSAVAVAFRRPTDGGSPVDCRRPQITVHGLGEGERPLIDGHVDDMSGRPPTSFSAFSAAGTTTAAIRAQRANGDSISSRSARTCIRRHLASTRRAGKHSGQPEHCRDADLDDTDSIQILLDTFNDGQNAFVFRDQSVRHRIRRPGHGGRGRRGRAIAADSTWIGMPTGSSAPG